MDAAQRRGDGGVAVLPYDRIGDADKAILSIKPRVKLYQANFIAGLHEAFEDETHDGAWPMAITRFKQLYTVRNGEWVERASIKKAEDKDMPSNLVISLQEQKKYKTVGGEKFGAEDFLVVEDPESPSTWHLQVKSHGKPDRRLMGAAKAALTSPGGFRGNKYAGPDKAGALRKLKALYKSEDMDFGESDADEGEDTHQENGDMAEPMMIVQGPTTFADLIARKQAREAADQVYEYTYQFQMLANNVMSSPDIGDKLAALKALTAEYVVMIEDALAAVGTSSTAGEHAAESEHGTSLAQDDLAEGESGQAVALVESDAAPAVVDVEIVQPGWGNARDNHYYPKETLARDGSVFKGAKMYATDHKPEQKSVLTEVSTILDIVGFSEKGAPIARVGIHNPEFAADVRNRAKLGVLGELHCSILAKGTARDYQENGRKGKLVESITSVQSVDWVTKAGAGGHAVALVENDPTSAQALGTTAEPSAEGGDPVAPPAGQAPEAVSEASHADEAQPVTIAEAAPASAPAADVSNVVEAAAPVATETWLSELDVTAALDKRPALHMAIRARVAAAKYHDLAEFTAALEREIDYFKQVTGSGSPFAQGAGRSASDQPLSEAEKEERRKANFNRVMRQVGMKEV